MANDGFIEFLSPNALSELKQAETLVNSLASSIEKINKFKAPTSPSGADNASKQMLVDLKAQEQAIKATTSALIQEEKVKQQVLATEIKQSNAIKANIAQREAERKATLAQQQAQEKAAKSTEREALANEKLNSAYNQLNTARARAKNTLRDLIASETASTAEIKKAQREFDILDKKVRKADKAVGDFSKSVGNYKGALSGLGNLMGAFGIATGVYLFADLVKNIFETTKELQSLDLALKNVSGSQEAFNNSQIFLSGLAKSYGIEIKGLTKNYTDFLAASKGLLSQKEIENIFTSVSKSAASMGLSIQATDSAFLALEQMMSKGTIQAEELKKQLGNALPGAMRAAAMAYMELHPQITKVADAERILMQEMKKGAIDSATYIPLIVKQFEKLYGIENVKNIDTLMAAQNRLSNSWVKLVRSFNESDTSGVGHFFKVVLDGLTNILDLTNQLFKDQNQLQKYFKDIGKSQGLEYFNSTMENIAQTSKENIEAVKQEMLFRERESVRVNEAIIKAEKAKRESIAGGNRALFHLQTKAEEDALVRLGRSLEIIKQIKQSYITPEKARPGGIATPTGTPKSEKQINIQDKLLKNDFDMAIKMLQIAKKFQEEIFTDEERTYAERLAAREIYSKISLDLLDTQNNREIAIEKDKANQLLKNQQEAKDKDLKANAENVKNGFADKRIEIENRYAENVKTINYNLAQDLYKIDLDYLDKTHELQNQDLEFFKKIQKEKERLTKETADIYFEMAQERRQKDANDENRTLTQRQASFEAWKSYAEAQLFFDEALAKSNSNQSPEQIAKITAEFDKLRNSINETISPLEKFAEDTKGWLNDFRSSFAENAGFSQTFKFIEDDFFGNIDKAFDEGLISKEEKFAAYFNAVTEMAQEAYNFLNQMSQQNFDAEYERLEQQKNISILFAGDSASAKAEIEEQYEQRRKQIARREAKAKKAQAIVNIGIDTAQAIVATLAKTPLPAGLPFVIATAALGAAQLAMVASQQIPQYWKGTDSAEGGLAWTQEKGREIITDSQGRVKSLGSDKGAELTMLSKGDKVFTAEKSAMMFDNSLNSMLLNNGIVMPKVEVSMDTQILGSKLDKLSDTIASKESFSIVRDAKGERIYQRKQNERKELLNNILNVKTYGV
jgi:tape measure domain-containing protein